MIKQNISVGDTLSGFKCINVTLVQEANAYAYQFEHIKTGARCMHLYTDDSDNLFSIAFRTPVDDSTGVPHILEHSVLAGSKKYPLKDPFKEMLKSSMQTFLNAITYPDRTVYPVSSQVEKDYFNLVDVYCDAVFNPLLTEQTFNQEGWHFDVENIDEPVSIKGIVYNEMKGVFSDFSNHVGRKMLSGLFPDTTYFHESGGEPEHITDLTYEAFKEFHAAYYHPSNSFMVLYGDIPSEKTLGYIEENFLAEFEKRDVDSYVAPQPLWDAPQTMTMEAPSSAEDDGKASVLLSYLWGDATDGEAGLMGTILSRYLFGGESAPLKRALIDSGLGEDLDDMCGFDNDLIQAYFVAGLKKVDPAKADAVVELINSTLQKEIEQGLDSDILEGALRRLEFNLREIKKGGHFPYPLRMAEGILRSWLYGGDPLTHLEFEKHLSSLRKQWSDTPSFFTDELKKLTINNNHRLTMVVTGSSSLGEDLGKATEVQSARLSKDFSKEQIAEYHRKTKELLAAQQLEHSAEELAVIPQLSKSDIPTENQKTTILKDEAGGQPLYISELFTAGITYFDLGFELSVLTNEQFKYYPLYAEYLTRCGAGGLSSLEMANRINLNSGGINCSDFLVEDFNDTSTIITKTTFHGKALAASSQEMFDIIEDILLAPDFEDENLIKNIVLENKNDLQSAVARSGHSFAIMRGGASLLTTKALTEQMDGITHYHFLKELLDKDDYLYILQQFKEIHKVLISCGNSYSVLTTPDWKLWKTSVDNLLKKLPQTATPSALKPTLMELPKEGLGVEISSSVNYVTQSWKLKEFTPSSMAHYYLMGRMLSTGYLWDKVRVEGGAYGGMAMAGSAHPVFAMASYRDPNLTSTLDHYKGALSFIIDELSESEVERSLSGAVGKLDIPKSPHSLAYGEVMSMLAGSSQKDRQAIRSALLSTTALDLKNRAQELLTTIEQSAVVAVANKDSLSESTLSIEVL